MQTSLVLQEGASCSWLPSASQTGPTLQLPLCLPQWSSTFKGKGEGMQATQQGFADGPASSCLTCGALLPSLLLLGTPKSVLSAPMPGHTVSGSLFPPQSH